MNKWIKLLIGVILLVGTIYFAWIVPGLKMWGAAALDFLKGGIVWLLILIGIILVVMSILDIKE